MTLTVAPRAAVVARPEPQAPPPPPAPARLAETLLVALAVGVVAAAGGSLFEQRTVALELAAAGALPVLLAAGLQARSWRLLRAVGVSVAGWLVFVVFAVLVDTLAGGLVPTADTVRAIRDGLFDGWAILLDSLLPLGEAPEARVFLTAACWATGLATGELAARTRLVAHPVLPPVVLATLLLLLHQPLGRPTPPAAGIVTGALLLIPLVRATPERLLGDRRSIERRKLATFQAGGDLRRRLAVGIPLLVVAATAGTLASQVVRIGTDDEPFDPRELRDETIRTTDVLNPLVQLKALVRQDPPVPAMTISFADPADALQVARVPLVRFDTWDGAVWTSTSRYRRTTGDLGAPEPTVAARSVEATVVLDDPTGPWLPAPAHTVRIDADGDLLVDPATGNLLPLSRGGVDRYELTSLVALPTEAELDAAVPAAGDAEAPFLALGAPVPPELAAARDEAIAAASGTWAQLEAIERWLTTNVTYDLEAPAGHSSARLVDLVGPDGRGADEQLAAAFTVMARSLGVPARLVVGYRVVALDEAGVAQPLEEVTSAQLHAWSEVHLDGLGWVAFDPSPLDPTAGEREPAEPEQGPGTTIAQGQAVDTGGGGPEETGPTESDTPQSSEGFAGILRLAMAIVGLALLAVVGAAGFVAAAKHRRRRRRRLAATPAERLLGAWDEAQDRLTEAGLEIHPSMTAAEIGQAASASMSRAAAAPLIALVPDVRRALFAAQPPNTAMAEQAWARVAELEQGLRIEHGRLRNLRHRLDPRPLRRR
ncbi:MAG: transglutaminase domain-containing protein, partial [Acidimicrobiales bacterium]|jgi:transglutaminase-like putative cysteine protease|nr:transglutaminase domain-containing protein [Acidimicrobiales bacterium]